MLNGIRLCALILIISSALLPAFTAGVLTRFGTGQLSLLILYASIGLGCIYAAAGGELNRVPRALWVVGALFAAGVLAGIIRADHKLSAWATGVQWLSQLAMVFALVALGKDGFARRMVLAGVAATTFTVAAYGVYQYHVELPMLKEFLAQHAEIYRQVPEAYGEAFEQRALMTRRAFGPFVTPNSLAAVMLLGLPLCILAVVAAVKKRGWGMVLISFVLVGVVGLGLFLSKSKGGWLAAVITAAAVGPFLVRRGPRWVKAGFWVGLGAVAAAIMAVALIGAEALPRAVEFLRSFVVRVDYWRGAWELIRTHPILGGGVDSFGDLYPGVKLARAHETLSAHNDFIQILAETGLVGLAGYVGIWIVALAVAGRRREDARGPMRLPLLAIASALVILAGGAWFEGRRDIVPFLVLWMPAALVMWKATEGARGTGAALGAAMFGYLVHSSADLSAYVPGVAAPAWALAAAAIIGGGNGSAPKARGNGKWAGVAAIALATVAAVAFARFEARFLLAQRKVQAVERQWEGRRPSGVKGVERALADIHELEKAIRLMPMDDETQDKLGELYAYLYENGEEYVGQRRSFDMAIEAHEKAAALNPDSPVHYAALGRLCAVGAEAVPRRWEKAADYWLEAANRYPTNPRYRLELARGLSGAGHFAKAAEQSAKALELEKEAPHEWLVLSEEDRAEMKELLKGHP